MLDFGYDHDILDGMGDKFSIGSIDASYKPVGPLISLSITGCGNLGFHLSLWICQLIHYQLACK